MNSTPKHDWIRDGLMRRGYKQKDLAVAWGSSQATVSRFLSGEELQDLPLTKALTLARMLGITCEELGRGMGQYGQHVEPNVQDMRPMSVPEGTLQVSVPRPGVTRVLFHKDLSIGASQKILAEVAGDIIPLTPPSVPSR